MPAATRLGASFGVLVMGCVAGVAGCHGARATAFDAGGRSTTPDSGADARASTLDAGTDAQPIVPSADAGPLGCVPDPGDGIETVGARFSAPGAPALALDALCDSLVEAICGAVEACSCGATVVARCRDTFSSTCAATLGSPSARGDVASGTVTYDGTAAGRIVSMLRAGVATCAAVVPLDFPAMFVAAGAFRGALPSGALCDSHRLACGAGLVCRNIGDFTDACVAADVVACDAVGICQERVPLVPRLACAGTVCDHGVPPGGIAEPSGRPCQWTYRRDGLCGCAAGSGESCGGAFDCASGYCLRDVCTEATASIGDTCGGEVACSAATCIDGTCAPLACLLYR